MFGRDDVATDDDIIGNAAESKSPAITSPSDKLHPILMEDCIELGNVVKSNEILNPACTSVMQHYQVVGGGDTCTMGERCKEKWATF